MSRAGGAYSDLYMPEEFGSAGGGGRGGSGGGRLWLNVTNTLHIDGVISTNGEDGANSYTSGNAILMSGGGSGGSLWIHCNVINGYGQLLANGGQGSSMNSSVGGGGGAGGRIALYFQANKTFSSFRFLAGGGRSGAEDCQDCEDGGPGTSFIYHMLEEHRTLIVDNNGLKKPNAKYVGWDDLKEFKDGCRAWILPLSGVHEFAGKKHEFHFEELQIYGNAHFAIMPYIPEHNDLVSGTTVMDEVKLHFKYMIGDRTGSVHINKNQDLDLERPEIDLPFNAYVYNGGHLGLAPVTVVHGVEIHLGGTLSNVRSLTLHHGGFIWLKHGGKTTGQPESSYEFKIVRIQDESEINAETDQVSEPGVTFKTDSFLVEGGGRLHGTKLNITSGNVTVDDGGFISVDGQGYNSNHSDQLHGDKALNGPVNIGMPDRVIGQGSGGGHGGSGGRGDFSKTAGLAYGDIYEPLQFGSAGGLGLDGTPGGAGGGTLWINVDGFFHIDGEVSANGASAREVGAGGGSGGSIYLNVNLIKGYGRIAAEGGDGYKDSSNPGSGGGGGRIAMYFHENETMTGFNYHTRGGHSGGGASEHGGGGTAFLYHVGHQHRTLIIDNGGKHPQDKEHILKDYANYKNDSCRTWIFPESGKREFAKYSHDYHFEELQIYGAAHLAVLTSPVNTKASLFFQHMIGDRTGTVHIGMNQILDLDREEIDVPFSVRVYKEGYLGLAKDTVIHGVSIWMHGVLDHTQYLTLHHGGLLSLETGGRTENANTDQYKFEWVRVQDDGTIRADSDPTLDPGTTFLLDEMFIEGGGTLEGTRMTINVGNITIDDGGSIHADSYGYRPTDSKNLDRGINVGLGDTHELGSSGAGHGGTSGRGQGTELTGQPYGSLFEPRALGSAGGGGDNISGRGGGMIWFNVTNVMKIDGDVRSNGGDAAASSGGGGSGGSIWIHCQIIRGKGSIQANGGNQHTEVTHSGGGGAGGRIALYFYENTTYIGTYQAHGGDSNAEPGGPGTVFMYHQHHRHSTLYVNNVNRKSKYVKMIHDYINITTDSFKAWMLPTSGEHWMAKANHEYYFDELQIYGNAHLAILPDPFIEGATLHFLHMIGDRSGFVHIGPYQSMDLKRDFIDTPFSTFVYKDGYLGLAPQTELIKVFCHVEGTIDHVVNLTLVAGGQMRLFMTGSTNRKGALNYHFPGKTIIKAKSALIANGPQAHKEQYNIYFNDIIVEGGGFIKGKNLKITSVNMIVDDGGNVDVSNGGYVSAEGRGKILPSNS